MIFWISLILMFLGIAVIMIALAIEDKYNRTKSNKIIDFFYHSDAPVNIGCSIAVVGGLAAFIMLFFIAILHCGTDAQIQKCRERYTALTFKLESDACHDEFGLLSKEIIDEIQCWNEDIAYGKQIQDDFWIGIFYPNIYDEFETIDYERYTPQHN